MWLLQYERMEQKCQNWERAYLMYILDTSIILLNKWFFYVTILFRIDEMLNLFLNMNDIDALESNLNWNKYL